jgi:hypothetical protein
LRGWHVALLVACDDNALLVAVLHDVSAAWSVLTGVSIALTLAATAGVLLAVASLWRLRRDYRVIEAAERFEAVNLSRVLHRYVPLELRTKIVVDEIAIAKQVIGTRRLRRKRIAIISGVVVLCGATATAYSTGRNLKATAVARQTTKPTVNLDVLNAIRGVWGWNADSLQSCSENPQTIAVASDRKTLSVRYAKPYQDGSKLITSLDFGVVSASSDQLVLSVPESATPGGSPPAQIYVKFLDANSYLLSRSDEPMKSSGTVVRCPSTPAGERATGQ